jgi:hypothetical protein
MYEKMRNEFKTTLTSNRIKFPLVISQWTTRSGVGKVLEGLPILQKACVALCIDSWSINE